MKRKNTWLAWVLAVGLISYLVGAATVSRSLPPTPGPVSGYASGTALHVDAVQAGLAGPRLLGAELAYSTAQINAQGFSATSPETENQLKLQPTLEAPATFTGKNASARGGGLEVGVGSDLPADAGDTLAQTQAGSVAPPNSPAVIKDAGLDDALAPIAYASLLHSEAASQWTSNVCASSAQSPLAFGRGYAADAQLLNTGDEAPDGRFEAPLIATDDPNPERSVVQTRSFTYAVPNTNTTGGQHYGLVSEVRQTYAPISLARGPLPPLVIEVLGEWVYKTTVTGTPDNPATPAVNEGAKIDYFSLTEDGQPVTPTTTVIRISQDGGLTFTSLNFQDVFMDGGLTLPAALATIIGLAVGEDPRAIADPGNTPDPDSLPTLAANGTFASGAVDVIRLSLLNLMVGTHIADLRIGHFESELLVPVGGFICPPDPTTTTTTSTTTTTTAPTTTTTTTAPTTTTSTTAGPTTTTTAAPATTTTTAKPATTTTTSPPAPAPVPKPIVVQPNSVG